MDKIIADETGAASTSYLLTPGRRYALVLFRGNGLSAGTVSIREIHNPGPVSVGFPDALLGWDMSEDAVVRFEWVALSNTFQVSLGGGTVGGELLIGIQPIL